MCTAENVNPIPSLRLSRVAVTQDAPEILCLVYGAYSPPLSFLLLIIHHQKHNVQSKPRLVILAICHALARSQCFHLRPTPRNSFQVHLTCGKCTIQQVRVATNHAQLGSRLLDEKALPKPLPELAEALRTAYPNLFLLGNLVSGPGVGNAKPPSELGSMTPAWRKAVKHLNKTNPDQNQIMIDCD